MRIKNSQFVYYKGSALLEALFAILIFSMGILALVGLQVTSVKQSTAGKYRSDASLLVNNLIGQMWTGDRNPATLKANFGSPSGPSYLAWLGSAAAPEAGTVLASLPGADATPPVVNITSDGSGSDGKVNITIYWKSPGETGDAAVHKYTVTTQIN